MAREKEYNFLTEYEIRLDKATPETEEDARDTWLLFLDMLIFLAIYQKEKHPEEAVDQAGSLPDDTTLIWSIEPHERSAFSEAARVRECYDALLEKSKESEALFAIFLSSNLFTDLERLAFLLAFSASVSRKYGRISAVLQAEKEAMHPTAGLAFDLARFYLNEEERALSVLFDADSFLNRYLLCAPEGRHEPAEIARPLVLQPLALSYALGQTGMLGEISLCGEVLRTPARGSFICHEETARELASAYANALSLETGAVIELCGENGSGRRFLLGLLSKAAGQEVIAVDMKKLLSFDGPRQERIVKDLVIKSALGGALTYLYGIEETTPGHFAGMFVFAELLQSLTVLFLGVEKPLSEALSASLGGTVFRITLPEIGTTEQKILWAEAAKQQNAVFADDIDLSLLVSKYTMNPGRIMEAVTNTVFVSDRTTQEVILQKPMLEEQIRRICAVQFGETAKRLKSPFTWEDLKVDAQSEALLRRACERVLCRAKVMEGFGFEQKLPYGRGVSIVLYGPPGTGKTMAAQVIGNTLGLDVYRIDLSQISSKYIGETEKNLSAVFTAAKNSNAILFFDEADALFSKRTNVGSSNDKHANAETSYLLQKVEEYTGVSVLATNNLQNFDAAFKRRITYLIPIGQPDEATRRELWQSVFPKNALLSKEIDFRLLAQAIELTGSSIKSAALDASYRAAAEDREITYEDITEAVDMECVKNGRMGAGNELRQAIMVGYREGGE